MLPRPVREGATLCSKKIRVPSQTAEKAGISVNYMPLEGNARRRKPPATRLLRL
jgi:hypothetical protein